MYMYVITRLYCIGLEFLLAYFQWDGRQRHAAPQLNILSFMLSR